MNIIHFDRKRVSKICAHKDIFGVASIYGISRKRGLVAKILHAVLTEPASSIHATHPGNTHSRAHGQVHRSAFDNFSDNLMTRNQFILQWRHVTFGNMKIGAANTTGQDFK